MCVQVLFHNTLCLLSVELCALACVVKLNIPMCHLEVCIKRRKMRNFDKRMCMPATLCLSFYVEGALRDMGMAQDICIPSKPDPPIPLFRGKQLTPKGGASISWHMIRFRNPPGGLYYGGGVYGEGRRWECGQGSRKGRGRAIGVEPGCDRPIPCPLPPSGPTSTATVLLPPALTHSTCFELVQYSRERT